MKKKWRIVLIIVILLVIGGGIVRCLILENNKTECEREFHECIERQERGANIDCSPCDF